MATPSAPILNARPADLRELPTLVPEDTYVLAVDLGTGGPKVAVISARGRIVAHAFRPCGMVLGEDSLSIIVGTVLLCGVLYVFFSRTRLGIAMQAASQNQLAAYYMGIPVRTVFSLIWAISAGVAAVAAILLSPVSMIDVNMGFLGIKAFAAAVLGGFGSIPGALVGGIVIGIVEQLAGYYLPAGFQEVSANVVLLATLILRPQGLFADTLRKKV